MKKDIEIPEVSHVQVAAVLEEHKEYGTLDWNTYLINESGDPLDQVIIVSKGYLESTRTSIMRHRIANLPARSFAKIEFLQEDLLKLNNEYSVSYFLSGRMFHKVFKFSKNSIAESALKDLPVMTDKGVLAQ